ncbi:response regulator transcription factor [Chitinimonas sp. BJB300]|uniref:response regulator transcription factor n=1 Tax=Chitinimonas sp. BJB300 TaxID=1559339 RepID=UPI000C11D600|nr:response regulator transcription factor [Chitinimonas sp. BJB300]PHV10050.1 two-component system response regulator [Chitinimonas sp. BJB300]TSJ91371.1 response regulator transcription factor [Chitinimonas sp. BJB300]
MQHILLVDDDPALLAVLQRAFLRRGWQVSTAVDAASALGAARVAVPDCAVVDLKLGNDSGLRLIPSLIDIAPDCGIVMLTGYASIATAIEAIKLGAVHYLAKPTSVDEILAALEKLAGDAEAEVDAQPLTVDRLEWEHIQKVLVEHEGNISATARALNMHRRTLQRKLVKRPSPNPPDRS